MTLYNVYNLNYGRGKGDPRRLAEGRVTLSICLLLFRLEDALKEEPDEENRVLKPIIIAEALSGLQEKECASENEPVPCDPMNAASTSRSSPIKTVAFLNSNKTAVEKPVLSKSLPAPRSILKAQSMEFAGKPTVSHVQPKVVAAGTATKITRPTSLRHAVVDSTVKNSKSAPSNLKGVAPLAESECFIVENSPAVEFPPSSFPSVSSLVAGHKQAPLPVSKLATKSQSSIITSRSSSSKIGQSKLAQLTKLTTTTTTTAVATSKSNVDASSMATSSDGKTSSSLHTNLTNLAAPTKSASSYAESRLKNSSNYLRTQKIIYGKNETNANKVENVNEKSNDTVVVRSCSINERNGNESSAKEERTKIVSAVAVVPRGDDIIISSVEEAASKRASYASSKRDSSENKKSQSAAGSATNIETKAGGEEKVSTAVVAESTKTSGFAVFGGSPKPAPTTMSVKNNNKKGLLNVNGGGGIELNNRTASLSDSVLSPKHEMHDSGVKTSDNSGGSDASNSKVTSPDGSIHRGLIDDEIKDQPDLTVGSQLDHQSSDQVSLCFFVVYFFLSSFVVLQVFIYFVLSSSSLSVSKFFVVVVVVSYFLALFYLIDYCLD